VLSATSDALLFVSLNKYWGPQPNEVGNYCIVGHYYENGKMFGKLHKLKNGDKAELTDLSGNTLKYQVYNKYVVEPTDTRCTSQLTDGRKELTLITCTNGGKQRLVVKLRQV
jgi:sortase A